MNMVVKLMIGVKNQVRLKKIDGVTVQTHWYENTVTAERYEFKTNIEIITKVR